MLFVVNWTVLSLITLIQTSITDVDPIRTCIILIVRNAGRTNGPVVHTWHARLLECHLNYFVLVLSSNSLYFIRNIGVLPQRLNIKKWKNIVGLVLVLFFFSINKFLYMRNYHVNTIVIWGRDVIWFKLLICTFLGYLFFYFLLEYKPF